MSCAPGVLAARGEDKLASLTLLTTMIDFSDTGEIGLLMDRTTATCARPRSATAAFCPARSWRSPSARCGPTT